MICIVTDRRRRDVLEQVEKAAAAGVDLVQIREGDLEARSLAALVAAAVKATRGSRTRIIVNDRLDVALACGADGVHLRSDSIPPAAARALAPKPFLVGRSVHDADEAQAAEPSVDFLIAGTVFQTSSKPAGHGLLGLEGLRALCGGVSVPVLAIGGITAERVDAVAAAGAAGIAGIGWFDGSEPLDAIVDAVRRRFDRAKTAS
jgi:thiamine-phosphate pyrophosphorylase